MAVAKSNNSLPDLLGGCLCAQVRYRISGPRRNIINCHCNNCRRTHGHIAAYTAVNKADLEVTDKQGLKWFHDESPDVFRGFCQNCGSSLFWDSRDGRERISVSAGTLDMGHGLKTIGHVYLCEAGEYYQVSDGLPQFELSNAGHLESG